MLALTVIGCRLPPGAGPDLGSFVDAEPEIEQLSWSCRSQQARWELELQTSGWTSGALLWLTRDGEYAELHTVPSIAAAPDGSEDRLRLQLSIASDWRSARPGQSTAFLCEPPPDGLLVVLDTANRVSACAALGEGEAWASLSDLPDCP